MSRVCLVLPYHWDVAQGGAEYRAGVLAERLVEANHEVIYLARNVPAQGEADGRYGYAIRGFQGPALFRRSLWGLTPDSAALYRALTDVAPDIILQFVASAYTGVAALYSRTQRTPMIWCLSSDRDVDRWPAVGVSSPARHVDRLLFGYGARRATCVLAQTQHQAQQLYRRYGRHATAVIPNFHPPVDGALDKASEFMVLWIGNHKPLKRPAAFLELAAEFEDRRDIRFVMIGREDDSSWGREIQSLITRSANVLSLGNQPIEEVNRRLEQAHLLVNTSEYEGFPNCFIQAWHREVPTLSLGVDPDGVIRDHGLGYVAETVQELARRVSDLHRNRALLATMGTDARAFAQAHYSLRNVDRFVELVEGLVAQRAIVPAG